MRPFALLQTAAGALALVNLSRGRSRRTPLGPGAPHPSQTISVVVPARDEAARIGPCLEGLAADPDVLEVVVVDDRSSDGTAEVAAAAGARVVEGLPLPPGWVGKPWALQQGLEAARGDIVITLDADTRPRPGLCRAAAAALRDADLLTAGARFVCERVGEWLLHPGMLTSIVYRFGPADADRFPPPRRTLSNGQCVAARRLELLGAGGFARARNHMTDDAALARSLAREGWRVAFVDGGRLLSVRMHTSGAEVWHQWGRSLAMPDVTHPADQVVDLAVVWLAMAAPLPRVLARRATPVDWLLLALRLAMVPAMARAYERRGAAFWLSPLADVAVAVRLTLSAVRPTRTWRGRTYTRKRPAARVAAERPLAPAAAGR